MAWSLAKRRKTLDQLNRFIDVPYLVHENGAELDFAFSPFTGTQFVFRWRGRDFEFAAERDHDIPPLVTNLDAVNDKRSSELPLVFGPDCLIRVFPKRESRSSWTAEVVAEAADGMKAALRALWSCAPEYCAEPVERVRFDDLADEFIQHSDYPEKIRPGDVPVWYMKCAGECDWFPKVSWTSDPPAEAWTADFDSPGGALPRFTMAGESPMPDFFNIRRIGFPSRPLHSAKIVSSRAREVIEAVAPGELLYRELCLEMPDHMRPAAGYFVIATMREAQMIDWDRSPKVLSKNYVHLKMKKTTVCWYHHIGHLIFRRRRPGDPHVWREMAPVSDEFDYKVPSGICMSAAMWTALHERFPGQLDQRSRSA